ncbi:MAG: methyltransferase [Sulfolobales archaeon]
MRMRITGRTSMNLADRVIVIIVVSVVKFLHKVLWRYGTLNRYIVYRTFIPFYFISSKTTLTIARAIMGSVYADSFCDIGSGSGYIAIELLKQYGNLYGIAIDVSKESVLAAKINARRFNVFDRIDVIQCISGQCLRSRSLDIAISNPPYLPCPKEWSEALCADSDERIYIDVVVQLIRISKKLTIVSSSSLTRCSKFITKLVKCVEIYRRNTGLDTIKTYLLVPK